MTTGIENTNLPIGPKTGNPPEPAEVSSEAVTKRGQADSRGVIISLMLGIVVAALLLVTAAGSPELVAATGVATAAGAYLLQRTTEIMTQFRMSRQNAYRYELDRRIRITGWLQAMITLTASDTFREEYNEHKDTWRDDLGRFDAYLAKIRDIEATTALAALIDHFESARSFTATIIDMNAFKSRLNIAAQDAIEKVKEVKPAWWAAVLAPKRNRSAELAAKIIRRRELAATDETSSKNGVQP